MARPHKPLNVLQMNGTKKNHPARLKARENEPENVNPLGEPAEFLDDDEIKAWHLIVDTCIPGVLGEGDTVAVAMASQLLAKAMAGEASNADRILIKSYLCHFGMTPSDRAKVQVKKDAPKNPFAV